MLLIGCEIFRGENDGVAGEAVTKGVERYPALAFGRNGAAGMGGVLAVDCGAIDGFGRIHKKNIGRFCAGERGCLVLPFQGSGEVFLSEWRDLAEGASLHDGAQKSGWCVYDVLAARRKALRLLTLIESSYRRACIGSMRVARRAGT